MNAPPQLPRTPLGSTGLTVPPIVFGTSSLGNLFEAISFETKLEIVRQWFAHVDPPVVIDSAGKYGAGLALEVLGRCLRELGISPEQVIISNKLGWIRTPLTTPEPTFEPGAWIDLAHDARQRISYAGIRQCWAQGCELLGGPYRSQLVSVHDPDEYLAAAADAHDRARRLDDVVEAYRALGELKAVGEVQGVGVGAKDWRVIQELDDLVELDWVMIANSLTLYQHSPELLEFVASLAARGVGIINSALFQSGFLLGAATFDYVAISPDDPAHRDKFAWRDRFHALCQQHHVPPAAACVQFGLSPRGVAAVALNSNKPCRVVENVALLTTKIPAAFWHAAQQAGLIASDYPYLPA